MKYICLIIISALWLCGCAERSVSDMHLDAAEALIQRDPVAAQAYLDSLNTALPQAFIEPAAQARYILLDTYCKYRNYEPFPDDSLISVAEPHILQQGSHHDKMLCLYLHGYILMRLDDNRQSMLKLKAALDEGLACKDHLMLGQIYTCLSVLCGELLDDDQILYAEKALEHYLIVGREPYIVDSQMNIGIAKLNYGQNEQEILEIFRKVRVRALELNDTIRLAKCYRFLAETEMDLGMMDSACVHYEMARKDYHARFVARDYDQLAFIYASLNRKDSAFVLLTQAEPLASSPVDYSFHLQTAVNVYNTLGEYAMSKDYYTKRFHDLDSAYSDRLRNTVSVEQRDYVEQKLEVSKKENLYYQILLGGSAVLLLLALFLYNKKKRKTKALSTQLVAKTENEQRLQQIRQVHEARIEQLENVRKDAVYHIKTSEVGSKLYQALSGETVFAEEDWQALTQLFKELLPVFSDTFLVENSIGESEWKICMLVKLEFKPKEIAVILRRTVSTVSSVTNRLYKKKFPDSQGGSREWSDYIRSL